MTRLGLGLRLGLAEQARRPLLPILVVVLPFIFITRAIASTEAIPRTITLSDGTPVMTTMREIHGASMAAITVAFLGGILGVFALRRQALDADRRLVVAGLPPREALLPRFLVLGTGAAVAVVVSLAVTALSFAPASWAMFSIAILFIAATYACLGVITGLALGPLAATYVILFLAMLDLGIAQNAMFGSGSPAGWAMALPGFGAGRLMTDAAFGSSAVPWAAVAAAAGWLVVTLLTTALVSVRRVTSR
jgi:hypothetical protein